MWIVDVEEILLALVEKREPSEYLVHVLRANAVADTDVLCGPL